MIKGEKTMSEKKTTEMNELLEEANEMSLGEEAGAGILNTLVTVAYGCGLIRTISAECFVGRRSCNPFVK